MPKSAASKLEVFAFVAVLVLLYVSICIETDMYVPAFPQMVKDLGVNEDQIQGVLSINFLGLCVSSLFAGSIADSFGRRKTILIGMTVFVIASLGCVWSTSLSELLFWRLIQGIGAGAPMTAGFAITMDRFNPKTAASLVGLMNSVITISMAAAPIVGTWITFHYHWRVNLVIISIVGIVALLSFYFVIPETLPIKNRSPFRLNVICKDYFRALTHTQFISYCLICTLIIGGSVVFISNQSLIFLNYLKVEPSVYGYYQASSMICFAFASLASTRFIKKFHVLGAKRACVLLVFMGGIGLLLTAHFAATNPTLICLFVSIISLGGGLGIGSMAASAMDIFPKMKATSSGVMGFIRLITTAAMISLSAYLFTGSVVPLAWIVGGAQIAVLVIYWNVHKSKKDDSDRTREQDPITVIH